MTPGWCDCYAVCMRKESSFAIGCVAADARRWSKVMWDVTADLKYQERVA